jgi:hypothetical protein
MNPLPELAASETLDGVAPRWSGRHRLRQLKFASFEPQLTLCRQEMWA